MTQLLFLPRQHWLHCLAALLLTLVHAWAVAAETGPLELRDDIGELDGWPAVRVLRDEAGVLTHAQALARLAEFSPPTGPHANLGPQRGAAWLYLPVRVPAGHSGQWLLEIDYALLQRIEAVQISGGKASAPVALGTVTRRNDWPIASRAPLVPMALEPGQDHALLLRIETAGGMVMPLRLFRPLAYKKSEDRVQALHGLICGLELFLLIYSLTRWAMTRDAIYLAYACLTVGLIVGFLSLSGMGPQHLWPGNAWFTLNAGLATVFFGLMSIFWFLELWMRPNGVHRVLLGTLRAGFVVATLSLVAFVTGLIDYRTAQTIATTLGPMPIFLALPSAYRRARAGSRQALYMFLGWACYAFGPVTLAALVRGVVPANVWTQYAFQGASIVEMVLFMVVLGLRVEEMRQAAEKAQREHGMLQALAHTDPLTGLLNRRGLDHALALALQDARPDSAAAVFLLDLDGFKPVNDRLGHDVGDALLVAVGTRLKAAVRVSDTVARIGGDEFVLVVSSLPGADDAAKLGQKLLDSVAAPIVVGGHVCRVGATIGYALAPLDGSDAASLLKCADAAMYVGKRAGRHCVRRGEAAAALTDAGVPGARWQPSAAAELPGPG